MSSSIARGICLLALALLFPPACQLEFDEDRLACEVDGSACDQGQGTCRGGACCLGCWNGNECVAGDAPSACGASGAECSACASPASECDTGQCVALRAVVSLSAGPTHSCAADRMQTLWCWGNNSTGQCAVEIEPTGANLVGLPRATETGEWIEVAAGGVLDGHSCAIHFGGTLWCWGENADGQLGLGSPGAPQSSPAGLGEEAWAHVSAGDRFTCGVRDGGLWCWGSNDDNRLGLATSTAAPSMLEGGSWVALDAGDRHACALKQDQTLWCWGDNSKGQLGRAGVSERPGLVGNGFAQVSAGSDHTCGVRVSGALYCWGDNAFGQLGVPGVTTAAEPAQVGSDEDWERVASGRAHSCGVKKDGTLWCWGDNTRGQLGLGAGAVAPTPARVPDRSDWSLLETSADHACAVTRQGLLFCWGAGDRNQHGLGTTDDVPIPTLLTLSL